jgi:hypothetical protein
MRTLYLTFAYGEGFEALARRNIERYGSWFDDCQLKTMADVDVDFAAKHAPTLKQPRGSGYWLWKPYFVDRALNSLDEGDCLVYTDAGREWLKSPAPLLADTENVTLFMENEHVGKQTKPEVMRHLDGARFADRKQHFAGAILLRNTAPTRALVAEWLLLCQNPYLLTDVNLSAGFRPKRHRHDQSILSLLCYARDADCNPQPKSVQTEYLHHELPVAYRAKKLTQRVQAQLQSCVTTSKQRSHAAVGLVGALALVQMLLLLAV